MFHTKDSTHQYRTNVLNDRYTDPDVYSRPRVVTTAGFVLTIVEALEALP